jgi:uncharacterized protein (DUF2235 family)
MTAPAVATTGPEPSSPAGVPRKKRLALFLDGTWNKVSDNTNVWRFRALIAQTSADGSEQRAYYSTGLGTKFGEKIRGGMFGQGINTAITTAYEWLIDNYEPEDEIFIFGFSGGAYTARSLSGLVSKCGVLDSGAPLGVNQLYCRYRRPEEKTIRQLIEDQKAGRTDFKREERWLLAYSRPVPIKFIGVFDTVGALGVPFPVFHRLFGSAYPFLNTGLRLNNEYAFHALALDEHRKAFAPTLWTNMGAPNAAPRPIERTEQRWFVGAHANVGGGCFDDALVQIPFSWIEQKASAIGLAFRKDFPLDSAAASGDISDSFANFVHGLYRLARLNRRYYRPIGIAPKEEGEGVKVINETIDSSVFYRWRLLNDYRPPSLQQWAERFDIDPATVTRSVRAEDPSVSVAD